MRVEYTSPEMEVIYFPVCDVITSSGDGWSYPEDKLEIPNGGAGKDEW